MRASAQPDSRLLHPVANGRALVEGEDLMLWDVGERKLLAVLATHWGGGRFCALATHPDADRAFLVDADQRAGVIDVEGGRVRWLDDGANAVALLEATRTPDGRRLSPAYRAPDGAADPGTSRAGRPKSFGSRRPVRAT